MRRANIAKAAEKWFVAYDNIQEMMKLRNYTPSKSRTDFDGFLQLWQTGSQSYLTFYQPGNPTVVYAFFPGDRIDVDALRNIFAVMDNFKRPDSAQYNQWKIKLGLAENVAVCFQVILVAKEFLNKVKEELMKVKGMPPLTSRVDRLQSIDVSLTYYIPFFLSDLQYNPLKHNLQPPVIRLITSEEEKEQLRLKLIRSAYDKTQTLSQLLPMIYKTDPLVVWYDAQVGDVFYFVRRIGGVIPYFRIVVPAIERPTDKTPKE
jgi:DNA-directed RNA polymerase subunit H (RpoH/RPB5)